MNKFFVPIAVVICLSVSPFSLAIAHEAGAATEKSSPQANNQPFDIQFLDTMAKHHQDGIMMFKMAVEKAEKQEIKSMAQRMINDQTKEIPQLEEMRDTVKADAPEAINLDLPGMGPMNMSKLESATGHEFDHQFVEMTIKHHQGAVEMAEAALEKAQSEQVRSKAQQIHDKQRAEIAELEKIRLELKEKRT